MMIIDTTTLTFSSLLLHLQWVWRQKFLLRRHPTHKDQWALDGAVKATQRGFFATAIAGHALGIARLIAATALGNLPQKLTLAPHCVPKMAKVTAGCRTLVSEWTDQWIILF